MSGQPRDKNGRWTRSGITSRIGVLETKYNAMTLRAPLKDKVRVSKELKHLRGLLAKM